MKSKRDFENHLDKLSQLQEEAAGAFERQEYGVAKGFFQQIKNGIDSIPPAYRTGLLKEYALDENTNELNILACDIILTIEPYEKLLDRFHKLQEREQENPASSIIQKINQYIQNFPTIEKSYRASYAFKFFNKDLNNHPELANDLSKNLIIYLDSINEIATQYPQFSKAAKEVIVTIGNKILQDEAECDLTGGIFPIKFELSKNSPKNIGIVFAEHANTHQDLISIVKNLIKENEAFQAFYERCKGLISFPAVAPSPKQSIVQNDSPMFSSSQPNIGKRKPPLDNYFYVPDSPEEEFAQRNQATDEASLAENQELLTKYILLLSKIRRKEDTPKYYPFLKNPKFKTFLRGMPVEKQAEIYFLSLTKGLKVDIIDFIWKDNQKLYDYFTQMKKNDPEKFNEYHYATYQSQLLSKAMEFENMTKGTEETPAKRPRK